MPIFQDPDHERLYGSWSAEHHHNYSQTRPYTIMTDEKRTDREDGDMMEIFEVDEHLDHHHQHEGLRLQTGDRESLISEIKRRQVPVWKGQSFEKYPVSQNQSSQSLTHFSRREENAQPNPDKDAPTSSEKEALASPAEIERPRSALHSGDFREGASQLKAQRDLLASFLGRQDHPQSARLASSPTTPWYTPSVFSRKENEFNGNHRQALASVSRSRAPSAGSLSSSYVLKAPTSPLVHQANNTDLDFSPKVDFMDLSGDAERSNRRRTLPPETFQRFASSPSDRPGAINISRSHTTVRREATFPYQAHQPRKTLTSSYSLQLASPPRSYMPRPRRPSFASDISPIHYAPMVGSYEESILRGRMSTTPSKPLDFTAQIGVLGKGKCKANLKCPPHVTVAFPAVFYSYPNSGNGRSISDDSPSPYVGLIDLEHSLPKDDCGSSKPRRTHTSPSRTAAGRHPGDESNPQPPYDDQLERRKREKKSRRTQSPKAPPGGCYRIPQQGQLQIVIKNPNKTAVKLFLVPYDLSDMEPGTKTFIRQRSYSAGPVIDMPLAARKNYGTDRPEASLNPTEDPKDKPVLRYLIHLNICCPSKGRYYLYSTVRVVFANRVPDGKEKLRNETQYPEPRYSPYKPSRDTNMGASATKSAMDKSFRRRSAGIGFSEGLVSFDGAPGPTPYPHRFSAGSPNAAPIPFSLSSVSRDEHRSLPTVEQYREDGTEWFRSPSHLRIHTKPTSSSSSGVFGTGTTSSSQDVDPPEHMAGLYNKLSKGDAGYGGYPFSSGSSASEAGESLLAKRLRDLEVKKQEERD
ncbi:hypothetical protein NFIA_012790 [Paecilomyces variotii No. 5]|uniref:Atos-like conserved domain-containing protein n=1 Tax=Byssochlamys spectabilis (strain No. 5 / NBRC 109023) TaxID=1356009 RepID=V5G3F3_BYSSN|nr:hypothetical protein NFIA_012790 [Paecilomyces variotii No. 5]